MFGLGKKRSRFGKWLDKQEDLTQIELEKKARLSRGTISKLCNDADYRPKIETIAKIKKALKSLGKDVPPDDYFNL